jgi:hypothetical protein
VLFMLVVDYFVMMEVVQFFVDIVIFKMVNPISNTKPRITLNQ